MILARILASSKFNNAAYLFPPYFVTGRVGLGHDDQSAPSPDEKTVRLIILRSNLKSNL